MKNKRPWVICDIDGTLADTTHRDHMLKGKAGGEDENKDSDWDAYTAAGWNDPPIVPIIELVRALSWVANIAFVTSRSDKFRHLTSAWIDIHVYQTAAPHPYELHMRLAGDSKHDYEIKWDIYMAHFISRKVWFAIEDRQQCVDMWRKNGIICLQPKVTL